MLFSNQALLAVLAGLTSVRAQSKPCFQRSERAPPGYFDLASQECCSPQFAVRENGEVQCSKTAGTPVSTGDFPQCTPHPTMEPSCQKGIRMSPEDFPQQGRCGAEKGARVSGSAPNDKVGCYSGRLFVNGGKCCSKDYVINDGNGIRCGDADMQITGQFPADNLPPHANVPTCNGTIESSWCPEGVVTTWNAIKLWDDVCNGEGCCARDYFVRDGNGVCRHFQFAAPHLAYWTKKEYFEKRATDRCHVPTKGQDCCPKMTQFRNGRGVCSARTVSGDIPKPESLLQFRTEDECHDYIYADKDPLIQQALNASFKAEETKKWKETVEKLEREDNRNRKNNGNRS